MKNILIFEIRITNREFCGDEKMNEKEIDIGDFFDKISESDDSDPRVKLVNFGQLYNQFNQGGLKYDEMCDAFKKLEEKIGEIPAFALSEKLPEEEKMIRYEYMLNEILYETSNSLPSIFGFAIHKIPKNKSKSILQMLFPDLDEIFLNENSVTKYCREWENQYSNFVKPIYDRLERNKMMPVGPFRRGRQGIIDAVIFFTENEDDYSLFDFILKPLDAYLRNALVHRNYFFDHKKKELVYYNNYERDMGIKRMSTQEFNERVVHLVIHRLIFTVRIAQKLSEELGIEWIRRKR